MFIEEPQAREPLLQELVILCPQRVPRALPKHSKWRMTMNVRKLTIADASMERSPGQEAEVFVGNLIDERHGGPITIGYGRYAPSQSLTETMAVDDVMIILEGRLSVEANAESVTAGPGEIVYMPKGETVTIRSHEEGAVTAYLTYPHWRPAHS
jgi:ethanolamine utilization protein EutQ (cupin superfamily)